MGLDFRIAIGSCRCADGLRSRNGLRRELCKRIHARIERLRLSPRAGLASMPPRSTEVERIQGRRALLSTCRSPQQNGDMLVVVQGFMQSWWFPTYISLDVVGYIYADGFVVRPSGEILQAADRLLWDYR